MSTEEKRITVEDAGMGDGFGFRVQWSACDHLAEFEVYEIVGRDSEHAYFDAESKTYHQTTDIDAAKKYVHGCIKWDGCSHMYFANYLYICGSDAFKKHISLMRYLYLRASELMGRGPDGLDEPWGAKEPEIFKP